MKPSILFRTLWLLGGLALLLGFGRERILGWIPAARELPRFDGATGRAWISGGFDLGGREHKPEAGLLPAGIQNSTSWVGGDEWQGRAESAWFKANRRVISVGVKGYPQDHDCRLWAEFRAADGAITRITCPLLNPREAWAVWEITTPGGAVALRVVGEDHSTKHAGWIAFSHPFRAWPASLAAVFQSLQLLTTAALVLTLVWGPGLLWHDRVVSPSGRAVLLVGLGPLLLSALGVGLWGAGFFVSPQAAGFVLVGAWWLTLGATAQRRGFDFEVSRAFRRVLGISALIVAAVVAKSAYSVGPQGELFRGTVSRNFEMSDRIDSRFSFYTVQAAAHQWGPGSPKTERFFAPWTFFSRGPLAGLASIPVVLATNGRPSTELPENPWSPYDPTGFAAYRVTMIVLASTVIVALFLILLPLVGEGWAALAAGLLALTPFGVHEVMFTWPKWVATTWIVLGFGLAHARRPLGAGLALGIGFLFHPLALLWAPWIGLWSAGRSETRTVKPLVTTLVRFGAGALALVLPWMVIGALMPHLPTTVLAGQGGFLRYWTMADWHYATWTTWWHTRWLNFANTFLPLHLYFSPDSFNHPKFGSAYEESGRLVKFAEVWWNTLPFAAGLGLWALSGLTLVRAARGFAGAALLLVIGPALFIVAYWGMDPLGLMRECGHPLLVTLIGLTVVVAAHHGGRLERLLRHRATPWLQLPETWLMLWLTTLLNPVPWAGLSAHLDPVYLTLNTTALLAAAWVIARNRTLLPPSPASQAPVESSWHHVTQRWPGLCNRRTGLVGGAVCLCLALQIAVVITRQLTPAFADLPAKTAGSFQRDGEFPGEPLAGAHGLRTWGSWGGDDLHTGRLELGPFPAPSTLRFAAGGYPARAGNQLYVERTDPKARLPVATGPDIGERWRMLEFVPPADWIGRPVVLVADDAATQIGGWLAVSEPVRSGPGGGNAELCSTLAGWALNGLLYGLLWFAALRWLHRRRLVTDPWLPLAALAAVAAAGYLTFFAFFASALLGKLTASVLLLLGFAGTLRPGSTDEALPADALAAPRLLVVVGIFYLALLHLFPSSLEFHALAANRFNPLPGDNSLPHNTARELFRGAPLRTPGADWLSSDRPPLQAGWLLLAKPVTMATGLDERTTDGTAAVWLQLGWIFAAYGLLRQLGLPRPRALAWTTLLAASGFFLLNSVYTWPKLSAAAFVIGAYAVWFGGTSAPLSRRHALLGAALAALAWLSHGGVAFSFLALAPWVVWRALRGEGRHWLAAAGVFLLFAVPWLAYQKYYDPPANRLLKWHLGGQIEKDARGTWETIRDGYRALPAGEIVARRVTNLRYQVGGDWSAWRDFAVDRAPFRRSEEFFRSGRALTWWLLGAIALPLALLRRRPAVPWVEHRCLAAWVVATTLVWCLLMFLPEAALIHQGSYAALLGAFVLLAAWSELAGSWTLAVVAAVQLAAFVTTWLSATPVLRDPLNPVAAGVMVAAAIGAFALAFREQQVVATEKNPS